MAPIRCVTLHRSLNGTVRDVPSADDVSGAAATARAADREASHRRPSRPQLSRRPGDVDDRCHVAGGRPGQARVRHHRQRVRPRLARSRRVHAGTAPAAVDRVRGRSIRPAARRGDRLHDGDRRLAVAVLLRHDVADQRCADLRSRSPVRDRAGVRPPGDALDPAPHRPRRRPTPADRLVLGNLAGRHDRRAGLQRPAVRARPRRARTPRRRSFAGLGAIATFAIRYRRPQVRTPSDQAPTLHHALEGLRFIRRRPILLGAISLDLFAVLFGGAMALLPAIAEDRLHVGNIGYGWLRAAPGVGAVIVSGLLAIRPVRRRVGSVLFIAVGVFGAMTIVLGTTSSYAVAFGALVVLAAADSISVFIRATLVPLATPDHMRGRVSAVENVFIGASNELGAFESGVAAALLGVGPAVVLGGVATMMVAGAVDPVVPRASPRRHVRRCDRRRSRRACRCRRDQRPRFAGARAAVGRAGRVARPHATAVVESLPGRWTDAG